MASGFCQPVTVGDCVWNESNGNGAQDSCQQPINGVTLSLPATTRAGVVIAPLTTPRPTPSSTLFPYTTLFRSPGTYTVTVTPPAGYTATATGKGNTATDSNVSP